MYRPEIKVMDCTVRDGGLMNNWKFEDSFVKKVYQTCVDAGVDYMEIGYKSSPGAFSKEENGAWKFCDEVDLRRIVGNNDTSLKLVAMADIGRIEKADIAPKSESVLDMIRVACYVHQVDKAIDLAEYIMDLGYETTINLMAVSKVIEHDLDQALKDLAKSRVPIIYLVDSFGSMYCEQIEDLVKKYISHLPGKTIGFHGHNNMQLAFANTIETIIHGANFLDATILGIGRGAGNCHLETLMAFLKNPKYKIRPILDTIQNEMLPLQKEITWGFHMPYLITGVFNEHPRSAIKWMESDQRNDFVAFYDKMFEV